jgi:hypothetical protein
MGQSQIKKGFGTHRHQGQDKNKKNRLRITQRYSANKNENLPIKSVYTSSTYIHLTYITSNLVRRQ